jgi:membrane protein involved in colicin uptake
MGIQLKNSGGGDSKRGNLRGQNNGAFGFGDIEETPQMREMRMKREANAAAAKEELAKKQEEQRQKALAFEQMEAAKRQREQKKREEEEIRNNPQLAAERERRLAQAKAEEEQRARFKAEEEAKIEAERRVQEKKMDQTEALIAAIRAQVEKEKAAKEEANKQAEMKATASNKSSSGGNSKPQFRTISPEEMAKLEEKKRLKAAGIQPEKEEPASNNTPKQNMAGISGGVTGGISGGLGGLGNGPTLTNPKGDGPTLSNLNAGQESLNGTGLKGGGLGIDITASVLPEHKQAETKAEENTVALSVDEINAAVEKSKEQPKTVPVQDKPNQPKPHTPTQVVGGSSTIIVDDGSAAWGGHQETVSEQKESVGWVESGEEPQHVQSKEPKPADSFVDDNGDIISVVPVRQRPVESNDVQSAYNIDFDDDDDDDFMSFGTVDTTEQKAAEEARQKAEEEARRKAEEEARQKAEEEARRKAEEEAKRKAEEEARRKAEEEARRKAEDEARRRAEEEARRKAEEEARRKAEEEARRKAEEEARRKAEEEARRKAEEEARRKAEEEARRKAEEEARRKAEEEARRKAEEEARRKAEEEARRKAEEEARRKAEEEARRKAEEEARRKAEEEARRKAEEEARRKAEEEARRKAEEEALKYKQLAEEAARKAAEAEKALEAAKTGSAGANNASDDFALPVGAEQFLGKYLSVGAISDQIVRTMKYISENPSEPRNVVILGQYGFGTTAIAEDFARSFYAMGICKTKTIAKIKAGALNRANISDAIAKLQGGCLVVENAGVISPEKLDEIYQIVSNPSNDVVVIMTGQIQTLSKLFKDNVVISSQFKHLIQVHRITDMDVFSIAKNHAVQQGYPCEPGAENNLRRRMQEVESGNLDRVLKIVDNAVSKAHNREMTSGEQEHHLVSSDFE